MPGDAAEDEFAQPAVAVGAHDDQIGVGRGPADGIANGSAVRERVQPDA